MERCDCKTNGPCLMMRGELPQNQKCVEKRHMEKCKYNDKYVTSLYMLTCYPFVCEGHCVGDN